MKVYVAYDEKGVAIGIADTQVELARKLGKAQCTITLCLKNGTERYAVVDIPDKEDELDFKEYIMSRFTKVV